MNKSIDLDDHEFMDRAANVRRALEAGEQMSLGDIADRLGIGFNAFATYLAVELFRQAPDLEGVVVSEAVPEVLH